MRGKPKPELSIRIDLPGGGRFGPGKAALLEAISEHSSLNKAAAHLGMSYPRAKKLVEDMNRDFSLALVVSSQGGAGGGGSHLTDTGRKVLKLYRELCVRSLSQNADILKQIAHSTARD